MTYAACTACGPDAQRALVIQTPAGDTSAAEDCAAVVLSRTELHGTTA
jgi:hypothetical protein